MESSKTNGQPPIGQLPVGQAKPILTIVMLAKTELCTLTAGCLFSLLKDNELNNQVILQQCFALGQSDLPKARSEQLTMWYKKAQPQDIFMFIDADQTFTGKDICRSLFFLKNAAVVCGTYCRADGRIAVEPLNIVEFYNNRFGELCYGATGFMMISYQIVEKIAKSIELIEVSSTSKAYPFFYERIVDEKFIGKNKRWLGEDYSFCWLARQYGGKLVGYISDTIGHIIPTEKMVQVPVSKIWPKNSIVFYCGNTSEAWSPLSIDQGIGGSELAVINLTKYWAKAGYNVTVFCNCNSPGLHDGVTYRYLYEFSFYDTFDIIVIWRNIEMLNHVDVHGRVVLLDLHDIVKPGEITDNVIKNVGKICVKSKAHARMLSTVPEQKIAIIPNGGATEKISGIEKDKNYLLYASSYDRGIAYMLKWGWPRIKQACPDAYLKLYYGWNGFDAAQPKTEDVALYKQIIVDLMSQPGVEECGRIPQSQLLREKAKANIHYYVGDFQEIDCISVRESACQQAIPIVADFCQVFAEKNYCVRIDGNPRIRETQEKAADLIINLLQNEGKAEAIRGALPIPSNETWENTAKKWIELFQ